jgi:hypothetical protein
MEEQDPINQLNIELGEDVAEGIYSNLVIIAHSNAEFILDFVRILPGLPKAKVKTRVIMTPQHAKRLLLALQENIQKYEQLFGNIELQDMGAGMPPMGFSGPQGMA